VEIADKAIVCYRCGTPTAQAPERVPRRAGLPTWLAVPVILVIIALGVWLIPQTPPASAARWVAWCALVSATVVAILWLRRSRRR
jgi:cobalamin synthase